VSEPKQATVTDFAYARVILRNVLSHKVPYLAQLRRHIANAVKHAERHKKRECGCIQAERKTQREVDQLRAAIVKLWGKR
jgi:anti-sigma regulatory factor (Ser/Thr protein kinase)